MHLALHFSPAVMNTLSGLLLWESKGKEQLQAGRQLGSKQKAVISHKPSHHQIPNHRIVVFPIPYKSVKILVLFLGFSTYL